MYVPFPACASFLYCKPQRPLEVTYIWYSMKYILLLLFWPYCLGKLKKVVKSCTVEMSIWAADDIEVFMRICYCYHRRDFIAF